LTDYLGAKKTIAFSYDRDIKIDVFAGYSDNQELLATYSFDEITEIANSDIATKNGSSTPKLTL
jgi:hypothetical protein